MKISIIIPMYNAEKYIEGCLDSILSQDFGPFEYEIVVINDGSKDNCLALAQQYAKKNKNIHIYSQNNKGQAAARNYGIRKSSGNYVCFVDADDHWFPNSISKLTSCYSKWSEAEIITFNMLGKDENENNNLVKEVSTGLILGPMTGIQYIAKYNYNNGPWWYMVRREYLVANNIYFIEGYYCEDGMFTMKLLLCGTKIYHVDANVYCYILHPGSTVTRRDTEHMNKMLFSSEFAINYLTQLIENHASQMTTECFENCIIRRNSYVYFYLIRILRSKVAHEEVLRRVKALKDSNLYPFSDISKHYPGIKNSIIYQILIHPYMYYLACYLYKHIR
ncbi:glycosyltransferase family 2 protein [uncultured Bacteroides sp.]|uniref:glycosyltransferase family 2 protein n=1 Tax=uncultured Bacteroides sp. TaxID=162156 RepID=UPI002588A814|nr:glycosyltransferase family A protein [uncultured Bacteroides sp.]